MRRTTIPTTEREPLKLPNGHLNDYKGFHEATGIAYAEALGGRGHQEDALVYGELPSANDLDPEQMQRALVQTVKKLEHSCGGTYGVGSTLISAVIQGNKVHIANVGDSVAYLVISDARGNISLQRLNDLHDLANPKESKRVQKSPKESKRIKTMLFKDDKSSAQVLISVMERTNRLVGGLAVSRAIGDADFESAGLSHFPDVTLCTVDVKHEEGEHAYIILGCDGLEDYIEAGTLSGSREAYKRPDHEKQAAIRSVVKKALVKNAESNATKAITQALVESATSENCGDNVTVMVAEIKIDDENRKFMAIFDGHGGAKVSKALEKKFKETLIAAVNSKQALESVVISTDTESKIMEAELASVSMKFEPVIKHHISYLKIGNLIKTRFTEDQVDIASPSKSTYYPPKCREQSGCPDDRQLPIIIPKSRLSVTHVAKDMHLSEFLQTDGMENQNRERLIAVPLNIGKDDDYVSLLLYVDQWNQLCSVGVMDTKRRPQRETKAIISTLFQHIKASYPAFPNPIHQFSGPTKDTNMAEKISEQLSHLLHRAYFVENYTCIDLTASHQFRQSREETASASLHSDPRKKGESPTHLVGVSSDSTEKEKKCIVM